MINKELFNDPKTVTKIRSYLQVNEISLNVINL